MKQRQADGKKGIISFSPLAQGMLTDRYLNGIPKDSRVNTDGRFLHADQFDEKRLNSIRSLNEIAAARGESLAQMALKWVIRDGVVTSVLIEAPPGNRILENLKVLNSAPFIKSILTSTINEYARELGILKEKDNNFTGADVRNGLVAVVAVKHPDPRFEGQTKTKLDNPDAEKVTKSIAGEQLTLFFDKNLETLKNVISLC